MDSVQQNNANVQEAKKYSWKDILKLIVLVVIIDVLNPLTNTVINWRGENTQKAQMETERQQAEWEQQQKENELAPTIEVSKNGPVILGKDEYTKIELYNSKNNLAGGKLKEINGVVMVKCGDIRIKTLWIKDAVYNDEVPFDSVRQRAIVHFKELEEIEEKAACLRSEIEECLLKQGEEGMVEFDIRIGIFVSFEYSDINNDIKEQKYIVYLEEEPYCEVMSDGELHCDKYYLEYGRKEQGDEYMAAIYNTVNRILEERKQD
ncbi:MAG: hypothetical protein HDR12_16790 [Lachnospiraceae bacterium]|nr:hypothetical protein [Lachnospiraceae bacterium]